LGGGGVRGGGWDGLGWAACAGLPHQWLAVLGWDTRPTVAAHRDFRP
jgi:hypothetical protein